MVFNKNNTDFIVISTVLIVISIVPDKISTVPIVISTVPDKISTVFIVISTVPDKISTVFGSNFAYKNLPCFSLNENICNFEPL